MLGIPLAEIVLVALAAIIVLWFVIGSFTHIGPTELGLVIKRFGKELKSGVVALNGESGYQHELLRSGWHFRPKIFYRVEKHPFVQIDTDEIGVVIAQDGAPLPSGARSGEYKNHFGDFTDVKSFLGNGGEKGVQRRVLPPGTVAAIHPIGFLVVTSRRVYGQLIDPSIVTGGDKGSDKLTPESFGLTAQQLKRVDIPAGKIGIVKTLEGPALDSDQVAGRIGGWSDITTLEDELKSKDPYEGDSLEEQIAWTTKMSSGPMDLILRRRLEGHKSYQDYQAFLDAHGQMGIQHDVLSAGSYLLNPFLVEVEEREMLEVNQSQVAVIRSAVGLPATDISQGKFKFGALTMPGHRGLWAAGLQTGLYAINPLIYEALMVPTNIITLSWSDNQTDAMRLDSDLSPISGTSFDGFEFKLELVVQVHVPADQAPHLISLVGRMDHLVNGVLQPTVGGFFRTALQSRTATQFIEQREAIEQEAENKIKEALARYHVETMGVRIQDVVYPPRIASVLQNREIAAQEKVTYAQQEMAEKARISMESTRGEADAQKSLAEARVGVEIARQQAAAQVAEAEGRAQVTTTLAAANAEQTRVLGEAKGDALKAEGEGRAAGYEAQQRAIGAQQTALVAALEQIGKGGIKITPDIQVSGNGGSTEALASVLALSLSGSLNGTNGHPAGTTVVADTPETTTDPNSDAQPGGA